MKFNRLNVGLLMLSLASLAVLGFVTFAYPVDAEPLTHIQVTILGDASLGVLISIFFYWLLVRVPENKRRTMIKQTLLRRHEEMKRECTIQLLFATNMRSINTRFWEGLMDPVAFRDYFYRNKRERWYQAMSHVDYDDESGVYEAIIKAVSNFQDELRYALDHLSIDDEDTFDRLKVLLLQMQRFVATRRGTDDIKSFFGMLQYLLAGWDGNKQHDEDPLKKLLEQI